jgi:thiol-disulfide isomerase/thioredoxin
LPRSVIIDDDSRNPDVQLKRAEPMKFVPRVLLASLVIAGGSIAVFGTAAPADDSDSAGEVKLEKLTWAEFQKRLAEKKDIKYTMVDVWSTTCGPCKENFPHVLEMHRKYGKKGLAVVSLSLDDPTNQAAVDAALKFLKEKKSDITNILLNEDEGAGYEKLNINAIPAVFLYGSDGKEFKRFTMDDTKNQFTYEDVEKTVASLLDGKS